MKMEMVMLSWMSLLTIWLHRYKRGKVTGCLPVFEAAYSACIKLKSAIGN